MTEIVAPRFVPWLRTGLTSEITTVAVDGMATSASAPVVASVQLRTSNTDGSDDVTVIDSPTIELLGPANVVGLDPAQIVRRDPLPGATDAETNYFPTVELAAADLPWRFTPAIAAAGDDRLQPWLVLVVVEDRAGITLAPGGYGLDVLTVDAADGELPDLAESWAWGHVHCDEALDDTSPTGVADAYVADPAVFRSRLMCPRRLTANTAWIAALVPSFEAGRAAGLRDLPAPGGLFAWEADSTDVELPVYASWTFRTGVDGDFEALVKRLVPRELPSDVGRRTLDLSGTGGGVRDVLGAATTFIGALVSPADPPTSPPNEELASIEEQLVLLLNATLPAAMIPNDYDAATDDPVVGPTIHATRQAGQRSVPVADAEPVWFGQLNIEPHHRAAAGLGAEVVRADQEALMGAAWAQAESMRPVNNLLRGARAAWEIAGVTRTKMMTLSNESLLQIASMAAGRLRFADGTTMYATTAAAGIPRGMLSTAFRRRCATMPSFATRAVSGMRVAPTRAVTAACLDDPEEFVRTWTTSSTAIGADLFDQAKQEASIHFVETAMLQRPATDLPVLVDATTVVLPSRRQSRRARTVDITPDIAPDITPDMTPGAPSLESLVRTSLDPQGTIAAMLDTRVIGLPIDRDHQAPARLTAQPQFTTPMYARLAALNPEYLVPGIGSVPNDTVALLEVNSQFIEAFLAGLNNEMGREFLWREFPARLVDTWFQQFWNSVDGSADITAIRLWTGTSRLGHHRPAGTPAASLVLLITGTLVRRYPDTKVSAVEAKWTRNGQRREDTSLDGEMRLPVFSGNLGPGVRFFGFELDEAEARGSIDENDGTPGWFFVLEEQPHEPRFGFDLGADGDKAATPTDWTLMSWSHLAPSTSSPVPEFVDLDERAALQSAVDGTWADHAAAMARITLQRPVRMLVHADSMLPPGPRRPGPIDIDPFDPSGPIGQPGPGRADRLRASRPRTPRPGASKPTKREERE